MDRISKGLRSKNMSAIRSSKNKTTELRLIALFRSNRISGWRRGSKIVGKPDFVFLKSKKAVFVDGCFWHGCKCKSIPKQNKVFWSKKIKRNIERDRSVTLQLQRTGWLVARIKEHQLKKPAQSLIKRIRSFN